MKTKSFLLASSSLFALGVFLMVAHSQPPQSLHALVSQTHHRIKHLQDKLRDEEAGQLVDEGRYAALLGLRAEQHAGAGLRANASGPALVSYARGASHALAVSFVRAAARLPYPVLLYNLGLEPQSLAIVSQYCNSSRCTIVEFDLSEFPSHVSDETIHAFRPLIIQHALSRAGGVIFVEVGTRWWGGGAARALAALWARAASASAPASASASASASAPASASASDVGVLAWVRRRAVTSVTHPRMFRYLRAAPEDFLFVRQLAADRLVVGGGAAARAALSAWVRCALTADCIMPIGAQAQAHARGCRFDKKPQYRYSGCHGADASALSIIVSQRAGFDDARYAVRAKEPRWRRVSAAAAARELAALQDDRTHAHTAAAIATTTADTDARH